MRSSEWSSGTFISQSACYNFDKANSFSITWSSCPFLLVLQLLLLILPTGPVYRKVCLFMLGKKIYVRSVSENAFKKAKSFSKQELGFMRRIMTTDATTTKKLGTGAVRISNEERVKKETSCAMWRRSDGGLSMWNWRGRSKGGFQPHSNG
ncbi:hypothetical protein HID58_061321 [Brassica napus]|uniref:Uncharacterized protein n=1 Tax=Brassica napus TaxID=3708 RepID=A0ABQ7ZY92_BRANA|nr:hypothetical protein HID58_061321 [Brassica napus]